MHRSCRHNTPEALKLATQGCCGLRYLPLRKLLGIFLLLAFNSFACELTPEYKSLRLEVSKQMQQDYNACVDSTKQYFYYKAVAKCLEEKPDEHVERRCDHPVSLDNTNTEKELEHCRIFKPTNKQLQESLQAIAKAKAVVKCLDQSQMSSK